MGGGAWGGGGGVGVFYSPHYDPTLDHLILLYTLRVGIPDCGGVLYLGSEACLLCCLMECLVLMVLFRKPRILLLLEVLLLMWVLKFRLLEMTLRYCAVSTVASTCI